MKFENGYTIEAFIKLPDPFEGDHAWMGILSWEGRSGDAGKSSGWSPLEPTCSHGKSEGVPSITLSSLWIEV